MAKNTILINDFRAGELTPDMDARVDLKDYYRGCRILENAMPIIEGGVARVPGTYYVRPVKTDEGWCLRVTKSGTGTGVVTSDLIPGINCGSDCYVFFVEGITVVLTATPDAGNSFVMWSGDGTGTVTRSVFMDGDKVVNAEFSASVPDYLIGWYKNDDGSGLFVKNYATDGFEGGGLLPNLDILGTDPGRYWTDDPGFGHSPTTEPGTDPIAYAYKSFDEKPVSNDSSLGMFIKRTESWDEWAAVPLFLGLFDDSDYGFSFSQLDVSDDYFIEAAMENVVLSVASELNHWYFLFIDDSGLFNIVQDDGTLLTFGDIGLADILISQIYLASQSMGDTIIYNNIRVPVSTSGYGYEPWTWWYDQLRSRYGMAARSGW